MKKRRYFILILAILIVGTPSSSNAKILSTSSITSKIEEKIAVEEAKANEEKIVAVINSEPATKFIGYFELTAYCPCTYCCGKEDGITKSGTYATEGRTVACNSIPLGTVIYIDGYGTYTVEDTGAMGNNIVDIFFNDHQTALEFGKQYAKIYIVK